MKANSPLAQIHNQLMWNRLIAVVEEQAQTLIRTAFSNTVREAGDLSAGVFDMNGRMTETTLSTGVRVLFEEDQPLVGALVAMGRLAADREILALEASGVSATRLVLPVVLLAGVMSCVGLLFSVEATPWAGRGFDA